MPLDTGFQPSFGSGEISPDLDARGDVQFYSSAARQIRNMVVKPQGGALRRGGTRYIAEVKDSSKRTKTIGFEFNVEQAYEIESGDQYFRFFKDKAQITVANTDAAIANGAMTGSLASWSDVDGGSGVSAHDATNNRMSLKPGGSAGTDIGAREQSVSVGASYQSVPHVLTFEVQGDPGDKIQLRVGTSSGGTQLIADRECRPGWHSVAFTPGAATVYIRFRNVGNANNDFVAAGFDKAIYVDNVSLLDNAALEISAPYTQANLFDDDGRYRPWFMQSNDVLHLFHPLYRPYKLSRLGHTAWSLTKFAFEDGPYLDENTTATTFTPSAATGTGVTITASSTVGINNGEGFKTTDVGRLFRHKDGSNNWGWGVFTGFTSTTVMTADILSTLTGTTATAAWQLGLYSDTTGWPSTGTFFEERLQMAGNTQKPNRWDGSKSGDFEHFAPTGLDGAIEDDNATGFAIASDQANPIRALVPADRLLLGTAGAEFAAFAPGTNNVITPTNVNAREQTRDGFAAMMPLRIGSNAILFVQRQGRELREIAFAFDAGEIGSYESEDMTIRAEHLVRGGLVDLAYQKKPFGIVWVARKDGRLLGFTYLRKQAVTAWHQHPIGGGNGGDLDDAGQGIVESVSVIPGPTGTDWGEDQLWLVVKRTIGGSTRRYIEILEPPLHDMGDPAADSYYVDSGLSFDGAQSVTLTPGTGATVGGSTGVTFTAGSSLFVVGDVGRYIQYRIADDPDANPPVEGSEARALITGYSSATVVTATILANAPFPSTAAIAAGAWRLSATTISGASHLEGQQVQILTDGAVHPLKTVSSGAVTLDYPAFVVHLGLQFKSILQPVEFARTAPVTRGKLKRIVEVIVDLKRSLGFKTGRTLDSLTSAPFRDYGGQMDAPPPLYTGFKKVTFPGTHDREANLLVVQDEPLPLHVRALVPEIDLAV